MYELVIYNDSEIILQSTVSLNELTGFMHENIPDGPSWSYCRSIAEDAAQYGEAECWCGEQGFGYHVKKVEKGASCTA